MINYLDGSVWFQIIACIYVDSSIYYYMWSNDKTPQTHRWTLCVCLCLYVLLCTLFIKWKSQIFWFSRNISAAWPHTVHYLDDTRNQNHLTHMQCMKRAPKIKNHCNASANLHRNGVHVCFLSFFPFAVFGKAQQKTKLWT